MWYNMDIKKMKFLVQTLESSYAGEKTDEAGITYSEVPVNIVVRLFNSEEDANLFFEKRPQITTVMEKRWVEDDFKPQTC